MEGRAMKTRNRILMTAISGALCLAAGSTPSSADEASHAAMAPMQAASLDVGTKHVIGYFLSSEGICRLTLMIAESADGEVAAQASRLQLAVEPGKSARLDAPQGASLAFACEKEALAMRVDKIDRVAAYPTIE
jgi:hypothetical protein